MELAKQGSSAPFETVHKTKDGRTFPVEISALLHKWLGRGQPVRG
jgi:hypothetical protein